MSRVKSNVIPHRTVFESMSVKNNGHMTQIIQALVTEKSILRKKEW